MKISGEANAVKVTDLVGAGEVAKAIPAEVYTMGANTATQTFEKLVAPFTEMTHGFGLLIRQRFQSKIAVEKALMAYALQSAVERAQRKAVGHDLIGPSHAKSFLRSLEEASTESDPTLREMWLNLLGTQIVDGECHPLFIHLLTVLSPEEARILNLVKRRRDLKGEYRQIFLSHEPRKTWAIDVDGEIFAAGFSFERLKEERLIYTVKPTHDEDPSMYLCLTALGVDFLNAVSGMHREFDNALD